MSDSGRARALIVEETVWGETPAAAGQLVSTRAPAFTRDSTVHVPNVNRGDRYNYKAVELGVGGGFTLQAPAQYNNFGLPLEGAFGNDEEADYALSGITFAVDGTANTITDSGDGFVAAGVEVGDAVYVAGFTTAANNGWHGYVTAVAAGTITLSEVVGATLVTEVAGDAVTIKGKRLVTGELAKSYSAEWEQTDLANNFRNATGLMVASYVRRWAGEAFSEETIQLIGKPPAYANATVFTGSPTAAPTSPFMNSLDTNIEILKIGGLVPEVTSLEITINTGVRARTAIARAPGPVGLTLGRFMITVSLDYYFDAVGRQIADAVDARDTIDIHIATTDGTNRELWAITKAAAEPGANANPGDPDTDFSGTATFKSFHDATFDREIGLWRVTG